MFKILKVQEKDKFSELEDRKYARKCTAAFFEPGVTAGLVRWCPGSRTLSFQGEEMHWNAC